jgi:hypothetical protein
LRYSDSVNTGRVSASIGLGEGDGDGEGEADGGGGAIAADTGGPARTAESPAISVAPVAATAAWMSRRRVTLFKATSRICSNAPVAPSHVSRRAGPEIRCTGCRAPR